MNIRRDRVGYCAFCVIIAAAFVWPRAGKQQQDLPADIVATNILTKRLESQLIVTEPNQEYEVRFRCPELGNSGLVTFRMIDKSCSCMDGYASADDDNVPVAVLKLRLMPNRHLKEGAGTFRAQTPQGERDVRVLIRIDVFPQFWTSPEDVRMVTLSPGELQRTIKIVAGTASSSDPGDKPLALMPLPPELSLVSSVPKREKIGSLWVSQIESVLRYTPSTTDNLRATRIAWKSPNAEYERTIYWSSTQGITCRPSHLFLAPRRSVPHPAWDGEILVASAFEPIQVQSISCPDAKVSYVCASNKAERQKKVRLSIDLNKPDATNLKLTVRAKGASGVTSDVELPVFISVTEQEHAQEAGSLDKID